MQYVKNAPVTGIKRDTSLILHIWKLKKCWLVKAWGRRKFIMSICPFTSFCFPPSISKTSQELIALLLWRHFVDGVPQGSVLAPHVLASYYVLNITLLRLFLSPFNLSNVSEHSSLDLFLHRVPHGSTRGLLLFLNISAHQSSSLSGWGSSGFHSSSTIVLHYTTSDLTCLFPPSTTQEHFSAPVTSLPGRSSSGFQTGTVFVPATFPLSAFQRSQSTQKAGGNFKW